jgi:hypothetical protein
MINDAEAGLRLAITALVADVTREASVADASRALRTIHGVAEGLFTVKPF